MRRNLIRIKKSFIYDRIFGPHSLLSINPKISTKQKKYFENLLKNKKVKLIHAHFGPSGLEILGLAKKLEIPLLVSFHGYDASILISIEKYRQNIKKIFDCSHVIAVSEYMKDKLISCGAEPSKIYMLKYGIPIEFYDFVKRKSLKEKFEGGEKVTFLQVSNFVEKKGQRYTVLAFRNLLKYYKNIRLILAGDGFLRSSIENLCSELNIRKHVEFPGLVNSDEVRKLMNNADVFLHHSITSEQGDQEGIPNVIMEAMATGLPVISTFHSGIPELIDNNYNGFLVEEKDIDSYTKVLLNLVNLSEDLGIKARDKILREFNLEKQSSKLLSIYDEFL